MESRKILITSALPYVNNVPHLGNLIGCVLSADVFARYNRSRGRKVLYICGTDEYGTATEAKALEEGISPKQLCDKYHAIHKQVYEWFGISFDEFGRTSNPKHTQIVQSMFLELHEKGFTTELEIEQPYDEKHSMFLADRFVVGECPFCASLEARADQCDKCGKLLTYSQLKNPKSKLSGQSPVLRTTRHFMIDLPKLQPRLEKWIDEVEAKGLWTPNTIAIARSWLKEGLEPRSITRDLKWGVPVPVPGWEKKVFYVWFDAPIGYISITAAHTKDYMGWWGGEEDVEHYEFIGKDNVPFHAIMFPATLLATGNKWTMPHFISSTEFLNYEDGKFSKSRGVGVFGNDAMESGISADIWRYYLVSNRPETSDNSFSWKEFGEKTNSELLGNFGNLVNRTLVFLQNNFDGYVPSASLREDDKTFLEGQKIRIAKISELMEAVKIRAAISEMMAFSSDANRYFQSNEPWKAIKEDKASAETVMNVLANQILDLAILSEPFMPHFSSEIFYQLNIGKMQWDQAGKMGLKAGHQLGNPAHLLEPIEKKKMNELRAKYNGKQISSGEKKIESGNANQKPAAANAVAKEKKPVEKLDLTDLELEVGVIEEVKKHPNAEKLYIEKVAMANGEMRQVVSGLVAYLKEDVLLGKTCVIVKNLKPAKLRGEISSGMLLAASDESGNLEILSPQAVAGTAVEFEGVKRKKEFREISVDEFFTIKMEVKDGIVFADGKKVIADGEGIRIGKVKNGIVK